MQHDLVSSLPKQTSLLQVCTQLQLLYHSDKFKRKLIVIQLPFETIYITAVLICQ